MQKITKNGLYIGTVSEEGTMIVELNVSKLERHLPFREGILESNAKALEKIQSPSGLLGSATEGCVFSAIEEQGRTFVRRLKKIEELEAWKELFPESIKAKKLDRYNLSSVKGDLDTTENAWRMTFLCNTPENTFLHAGKFLFLYHATTDLVHKRTLFRSISSIPFGAPYSLAEAFKSFREILQGDWARSNYPTALNELSKGADSRLVELDRLFEDDAPSSY